MKIGRNMIVAIMITFCFTATMFMVIPIRSATSPYDPWVDVNGDGNIDLKELVLLANSYGTSGDSTKNVNVTNWPSSEPNYRTDAFLAVNISWVPGGGLSFSNSLKGFAGGYSKMSIQVSVYNWSVMPNWQSLYTDGVWWAIHEYPGANHAYVQIPQSGRMNLTFYLGNTPGYYEWDTTKGTIDVVAPYYTLSLQVERYNPSGWVLADIYVYLRSE